MRLCPCFNCLHNTTVQPIDGTTTTPTRPPPLNVPTLSAQTPKPLAVRQGWETPDTSTRACFHETWDFDGSGSDVRLKLPRKSRNIIGNRTLVVGLRGAGKSTLIALLCGKKHISPSTHSNRVVETRGTLCGSGIVRLLDIPYTVATESWNDSKHVKLMRYVSAVMFVVDSTDVIRLPAAAELMVSLFSQPMFRELPLLIVANKEGTLDSHEFMKMMDITRLMSKGLNMSVIPASQGDLGEVSAWLCHSPSDQIICPFVTAAEEEAKLKSQKFKDSGAPYW